MHNAKHLIKLSSKSTVAVSFQIHERETLATTIAVPWLIIYWLKYVVGPCKYTIFCFQSLFIFLFAFNPRKYIFTFIPYCFSLVHVKFVQVEIGLGNMCECNIHSSPYVAHIGGAKIKFSTYYRDQFQRKQIFQGLWWKFRLHCGPPLAA